MPRKQVGPKRHVGRPRTLGGTPDKFTLRLPPALLERLEALAEREHRSVNAQLVVLIERATGARK